MKKEDDSLKRIEKILFRILLSLAAVTIIGIILMIRFGKEEEVEVDRGSEIVREENPPEEEGLSDSTYRLPEYCSLYEQIPEIGFTDEEGKSHAVSEWFGNPVVLVFWASWCSDCMEQMPDMKSYMELAGEYGDVTFLFINKTDGDRETLESAREYFNSLGLSADCYYDTSLKSHDMLGIHNIPTTIFLNSSGQIASWSAAQIEGKGVFDSLLRDAVYGSSDATLKFVENSLTDKMGGIHSHYRVNVSLNPKSEVLSESQGLILLYSVQADYKELFDQSLSYVKEYMWEDSLASWVVEDGEGSDVNALIDDFRIYRSLRQAQEKWGGYEEDILYCEEMLRNYGINNNQFIDFYDRKNKQRASRFTLCYGDMEAMEMLTAADSSFTEAYQAAEQIVEQGMISNKFPLYYSWYNYDKNRYEKDDLNSAEAMTTLYHLAVQDKISESSVRWLKSRMSGDGIKARYTVDGDVVMGYNFESTAVYAIVAMIAYEIEDQVMMGQALEKMEKMRISNTALEYNGAFGVEDGSGITSFDQLMPLLAYSLAENP